VVLVDLVQAEVVALEALAQPVVQATRVVIHQSKVTLVAPVIFTPQVPAAAVALAV
jgi:hypothetical protein